MIIDDVECNLVDDGTMDAVIEVTIDSFIGNVRLSSECASIYRDETGYYTDESFRELCENEVLPYLDQ